MPSLLHEGNQIVDGHGDVLSDLIFREVDVSDGSTQAGSFLGLELDGVFQFVNLGDDLLSLGQNDWVETHLDQNVTQKFGDLLSD